MRLRLCVPVVLLLLVLPARAWAQIGSGTDIITGTVVGQDGRPIHDAAVEAMSAETQITRRARTDENGRFTILFPDGGGQYRMTARAVGMAPRIEVLQRYADEDRLVWNVRLTGGTVTLDEITVRGAPQRVVSPGERPTPGSSEQVFGEAQTARLPIDNSDLALLASLVPGVLTIDATDTTATAFSVAGLGSEANALTLDGLLFGDASVPQEGLRQTRVITSTYDVSRGQFSGGLISSTTRGGSNMVQGSSNYQLQDDAFALAEDTTQFAQGITQNTLSGGIGGPIVKDRLFIFGSLMGRLRSDPQQTLLTAGLTDFTRLGVAPDSVSRFLGIVDGLGVPHNSTPAQDTRASDNLSGLLRLDYVVSNSHTLTLRADVRGRSRDPFRLGSLALPQTGGSMASTGGGVMATLTSRFGATVLNEFRGYLQGAKNDGDPFTALPAGRVTVASDLPDGTVGVSTLVFGGNAGFPSRQRSSSFEATDEMSWLPGAGGHRIKMGVSLLTERSHNIPGNNQFGTYTYNSLADLQNGLPASFRRTVTVPDRAAQDTRWSAYLGDVWMVSRPFQLTYGVRAEGSSFGNAPAYNGAVDTAFGVRTDRLPTEVHVSPRVGFTWTIGYRPFERGRPPTPPTLVVRGGIGEFRSQPPTGLVAQAQSQTGFAQSSAEIFCTGAAVPVPDWSSYFVNPASIPTQCLSTGPAVPSPARSVTVLADGFEASRAWRGSLGVERRLTQIFRLSVDASFSRGVAQSGFYDLNLADTPAFTLASEANRPVYVPAADITPGTGSSLFSASRVDPTFGHVYEARSNLHNSSEQVTVSLGGVVGRAIQIGTSYTWQRTRDQATGARGGTTAGDPNAVEWARSGYERRHSFLATITYPISQTVEITSIGRLASGTPFTPTVGGDVNGDGQYNDRAFIYAPGTGSAEALAMQSLLSQSSGGVRQCLLSQVGAVAARNSCTGPWQYSLDFQLNWRPNILGLNRRLTVSVVTMNFLRGLDELVNGAGSEKGWGLNARPDNTLLYITGFDPATRTYQYDVNERFGATAGTATAYRPPFQLSIRARMSIGPDRRQQALDAMRAGGGGRGGFGGGFGGGAGAFRAGGAGNLNAMIARVDSALPNPAGVVLEMRDSLHLSPEQVTLLVPIRDSVATHVSVRLDSLRAAIAAGGSNPDFARLMPILRPLFTTSRDEVAQAVVNVRAILTPEQWELVPDSVKNFQTNPFRGPGRPGGEGRPGGGEGRPFDGRP